MMLWGKFVGDINVSMCKVWHCLHALSAAVATQRLCKAATFAAADEAAAAAAFASAADATDMI